MLGLQRLLGIHPLDIEEPVKLDNSVTKYLNIFEGTFEEVNYYSCKVFTFQFFRPH
jgi:hypothetical protein